MQTYGMFSDLTTLSAGRRQVSVPQRNFEFWNKSISWCNNAIVKIRLGLGTKTTIVIMVKRLKHRLWLGNGKQLWSAMLPIYWTVTSASISSLCRHCCSIITSPHFLLCSHLRRVISQERAVSLHHEHVCCVVGRTFSFSINKNC